MPFLPDSVLISVDFSFLTGFFLGVAGVIYLFVSTLVNGFKSVIVSSSALAPKTLTSS